MSDLSAISEAAQAAQQREDWLRDVDTFADWLYSHASSQPLVFRHTYWRTVEFNALSDLSYLRKLEIEQLAALMLLSESSAVIKGCRDELARRYLEQRK